MSLRTRRSIDLNAPETEVDNGWISPRGRSHRSLYERFGKRALDISVGLILVILTLPVQIAAILLSMTLFGGPPIVRVPTVGKGHRGFQMLRIRTSPVGTRRTHTWPRVARILRWWGLNELPSLWNIVQGQMSLVGPRALRPEDHADLMDWQQRRRKMKPGLTGLWRVESRRNGGSSRDIAHYDVQYLDQLSFATDLRILARTLFVTGRRRLDSGTRARKRNGRKALHARLMVADLSLWLVAIPTAEWAHHDFTWSQIDPVGLAVWAGAAVMTQLTWAKRYGMYRGRWMLASPEGLASVAVGAAGVTGVVILIGASLPIIPSRGALLTAGALYLVGALAARVAGAFAHTRAQRSKHIRTGRLLIFGAGTAGIDAARAVWADEKTPFEPVAFLDDDPRRHRTSVFGIPVLGGRELIGEVAGRYDACAIVIAMPSAHPREVGAVAAIAKAAGLEVQILPPLPQWLAALVVERPGDNGSHPSSNGAGPASEQRPAAGHIRDNGSFEVVIVDRATVDLRPVPPLRYGLHRLIRLRDGDGLPAFYGIGLALKRTVDVLLSLVLLVLLAPVMLGIAIAVGVTSSGPVIYHQERTGRRGRAFKVLKFRSMVNDADQHLDKMADLARTGSVVAADAPAFKSATDPRVTNLGRFLRRTNLDELPQLLNVLLGHMSLVGPRPLVPNETASLTPLEAEIRHLVRPGITCLWQVLRHDDMTFGERIELDLLYVRGRSTMLDFGLIALTPVAIFAGEGSY